MSKYRDNDCQVPFCSVCWQAIKTNVRGVLKVADDLRNSKDLQANDDLSQASPGNQMKEE